MNEIIKILNIITLTTICITLAIIIILIPYVIVIILGFTQLVGTTISVLWMFILFISGNIYFLTKK